MLNETHLRGSLGSFVIDCPKGYNIYAQWKGKGCRVTSQTCQAILTTARVPYS